MSQQEKKTEMEPETEQTEQEIQEERAKNRLGKILSAVVLLVAAIGVWLAGGDPMSVLRPQEPVESTVVSTVHSESASKQETASKTESKESEKKDPVSGTLKVWFLDVGQADASLIQLPNGKTILIDAGESDGGPMILDFLEEQKISKIDYLVATHPHSDHIGGMRKVVQGVEIGKVYMSEAASTSTTYEKLLLAIEEKGRKIWSAKAGAVLFNEVGLKAEFISPLPGEAEDDDLNNASACLKLTYGETTFLFMGDAEVKAEEKITADVKADVVKVGHHGSETSSGEAFVKKVQAKIAVISVGESNDYDHPSTKIVDRWKKSGAKVWRTDKSGTVYVESDGTKCTASAWKS